MPLAVSFAEPLAVFSGTRLCSSTGRAYWDLRLDRKQFLCVHQIPGFVLLGHPVCTLRLPADSAEAAAVTFVPLTLERSQPQDSSSSAAATSSSASSSASSTMKFEVVGGRHEWRDAMKRRKGKQHADQAIQGDVHVDLTYSAATESHRVEEMLAIGWRTSRDEKRRSRHGRRAAEVHEWQVARADELDGDGTVGAATTSVPARSILRVASSGRSSCHPHPRPPSCLVLPAASAPIARAFSFSSPPSLSMSLSPSVAALLPTSPSQSSFSSASSRESGSESLPCSDSALSHVCSLPSTVFLNASHDQLSLGRLSFRALWLMLQAVNRLLTAPQVAEEVACYIRLAEASLLDGELALRVARMWPSPALVALLQPLLLESTLINQHGHALLVATTGSTRFDLTGPVRLEPQHALPITRLKYDLCVSRWQCCDGCGSGEAELPLGLTSLLTPDLGLQQVEPSRVTFSSNRPRQLLFNQPDHVLVSLSPPLTRPLRPHLAERDALLLPPTKRAYHCERVAPAEEYYAEHPLLLGADSGLDFSSDTDFRRQQQHPQSPLPPPPPPPPLFVPQDYSHEEEPFELQHLPNQLLPFP